MRAVFAHTALTAGAVNLAAPAASGPDLPEDDINFKQTVYGVLTDPAINEDITMAIFHNHTSFNNASTEPHEDMLQTIAAAAAAAVRADGGYLYSDSGSEHECSCLPLGMGQGSMMAGGALCKYGMEDQQWSQLCASARKQSHGETESAPWSDREPGPQHHSQDHGCASMHKYGMAAAQSASATPVQFTGAAAGVGAGSGADGLAGADTGAGSGINCDKGSKSSAGPERRNCYWNGRNDGWQGSRSGDCGGRDSWRSRRDSCGRSRGNGGGWERSDDGSGGYGRSSSRSCGGGYERSYSSRSWRGRRDGHSSRNGGSGGWWQGCRNNYERSGGRREWPHDELEFEIVQCVGILSSNDKSGWRRELCLVSWNGKPPKYDLRDWAEDHSTMSKGINLTVTEAARLIVLLEKAVADDDELSRAVSKERALRSQSMGTPRSAATTALTAPATTASVTASAHYAVPRATAAAPAATATTAASIPALNASADTAPGAQGGGSHCSAGSLWGAPSSSPAAGSGCSLWSKDAADNSSTASTEGFTSACKSAISADAAAQSGDDTAAQFGNTGSLDSLSYMGGADIGLAASMNAGAAASAASAAAAAAEAQTDSSDAASATAASGPSGASAFEAAGMDVAVPPAGSPESSDFVSGIDFGDTEPDEEIF